MKNIGTTARIERIRLQKQTTHPPAPDTGYAYLYATTGSYGGLFLQTDQGVIGPFVTGTSSAALASGVAESQSAFSTASTTYVDITNMTVTITTGARRCLVTFAGSMSNNTLSAWTAIRFLIDGVDTGNSTSVGISTGSSSPANDIVPATIAFITDVLSAGSHTFKLQMRVSSGTGKLREETKYRLAVHEL